MVTGVKSITELEDAIKKVVNIHHEHGVKMVSKGSDIANIIAKRELDRRINLIEVAEELGGIYSLDYKLLFLAKINDIVVIVS